MSNDDKNKKDFENTNSEKEQTNLESKDTESNLSELEKDLDFDDLPPDIVRMMISRSISTGSSSSLEDKINTEHISRILDIAEEDNKREFKDIKFARLYNLAILVIVLFFFGFLTVFLANKDLSTYQDIIRIIIIFGGGFGAGFGYKSRMK